MVSKEVDDAGVARNLSRINSAVRNAIDYLLNGAYFMSASGPVYIPKNSDGSSALANPMVAKDVAIRCVRDAF